MLIYQNPSQWHQRLAALLSARLLIILTAASGINVGLALSAPLFMMLGWERLGKTIYKLYSIWCHQFPLSSWFVFGQHHFYNSKQFLDLAGIEYLNSLSKSASQDFYGNPVMGWKFAYCQRDLAIFVGFFSASLFYCILRDQQFIIPPAPLILYLLFGLTPIALDGLSQLLSPLVSSLPILISHESSPMLRTATGFLFGSMSVWLAYPHLEAWMLAIRKRHRTA